MSDNNAQREIERLSMQLADARQQINSLKVSVRAEELKVKISSEYSNFGLWEYDIAEDVCYQYKKLNGRYEGYLDPIVHFRDTIIGWGTVYAEDLPVFNRFCDALERGDKEITCDVRCIHDNCSVVWFRYEGKTVYDDSGKPIRVVGRTLDVTEEKGGVDNSSDERHDPLTGAYTAEVFREEVAARTSGANRFKNSALLLIALDNLQRTDEQQGADYAVYLRKTFGKIIGSVSAGEHESCVGSTKDGELAFFARFSDLDKLNELAQRIVNTVKGFPFDRDAWITVSVGISIMKNGKSYDDAYLEASTALNAAAAKGGNTFVSYSPNMATEALGAQEQVFEENAGFSSGIAKVYNLVTHAFIDKKRRLSIMARALCETARLIGADAVSVAIINESGIPEYENHSADGSPGKKGMYVSTAMKGETLKNSLRFEGTLALDDGNLLNFTLNGGAKYALLRPIVGEFGAVGWFCFVSKDKISIKVSDEPIVELLSKALNKMYSAKEEDEREAKYLKMTETVLNSLRVEGFSILPQTFEVDTVGLNASQHYDLKKGDICYKKIYGRTRPCRECPAMLLDKGSKLQESCALYNEKEHTWLNVTASVEDNEAGERRYFISSSDITNCLGKIKNHDMLTGVMTLDMFTAEAMRLTSSDAEGYILAVINVANFRRINEDNGYEFGNSVLIAVADILESSIGSGELIGRSEGSRFIVLYKSKSFEELETRLNQLLASIQKQVYSRCGKQICLIAGVYEMEEGCGIMTALDRAITAQKTIKDKSYYQENLIARYDTTLKEELKTRRYIEAHMLEALDNDEFKVYYQPKVSIATGKVVGAEALVRWIRKNGEIISPAKFVPIFEANGFIADMDFAIYRRAIADIKRWTRKGIDVPLISLNVSRHHLKDKAFPNKLKALVDSVGVSHDRIELEITESLLTENLNQLVDTMTAIKSQGFRISIDDFGSGYSSLNLITLLPFDTLKIDGGFFLKNDLTERNRKVISSVVTLAKSLNLETVSEGVETQVQVDFLRDLGCDLIQGYFYYKPMPVEDFEKLISAEITVEA